MISIYFFREPSQWVIPWILQTIAYFFLLKKMNLKRWTALIPFLAERQFTTVLFRRMRTFYRPFFVAAILAGAAYYLGPAAGLGRFYMWCAFIIYGVFLIRLYWQIGRAMGKGKLFRILLLLCPILFLLILGLGRSQYTPLPMRPLPQHGRIGTIVRKTALVMISAAEILAIGLGIGYLTIKDTPPTLMVQSMLSDTYSQTKDITGTGEVVSREDAMGEAASQLADMKISRDHYFPDHSQDRNAVVMTYIVGSNLEDKNGLASANISQMIDATEKGDGLTFVVEAGGSKRWFTKGIENETVGRYTISEGRLDKVEDLPADTCMSQPDSLTDFISWTKENYPSDRYILVLWDHGGGVPFGYGQDDLNARELDGEETCMQTSEVVSAIKKSGVKFDIIGFDACLMQDIEIACAMEPCTDYYLASEEVEGGLGWFYTSAFGKLAENPGLPSEEFGREIIACYDPYNRITMGEDGEPVPTSTLSFVDTTLACPAYEMLVGLFYGASDAIREDPASFANMAGAASSAYAFNSDIQIDLIDFLKILDKMDFDEKICSHEDKVKLYRALQACILYRNGDSARGIYGVSMAFPYKSIEYYEDTGKQLKAMSMKAEKKTFDEIFSIMAVQQKKDLEKKKKEAEENPSLMTVLEVAFTPDYTEEDWYIKGFEDYDSTKALVDIPLVETGDGYAIEMPEKQWRIISDCQTMLLQKTDGEAKGEEMRYLGQDYVGAEDAEGHPLITMDDQWVHIDGNLVCYEAEPARETDAGDIYTGKVKAVLNGREDITLNIEWDPVNEDSDAPAQGRVTGYETDSFWDSVLSGFDISDAKNVNQLKAGDTIQFVFDYYDGEGNLVETKPAGGKIHVTKQSRLKVADEPLESCDIQFGGVLTDVYQRVMTTEQIEMHID